MKIKNIIILGGIVFAIYYLSKKKGKRFAQLKNEGAGGVLTVETDVEGKGSIPDIGDINLENVMNGDEPQSEAEADVLRLFKQANKSYTGGARPTRQMLMLIERDKQKALLRIQAKGLAEKFKEWKEKFGKKKKEKYPVPQPIKDAGFERTPEDIREEIQRFKEKVKSKRPVGTPLQILREKMPLPRYRTYAIDTTSSLGLTNMPPMAI